MNTKNNPPPLRCALMMLVFCGAAAISSVVTAEEPHCHSPAATPATETVAKTAAKVETETKIRIPDVSLVDQNGESVSFFSDLVDGKVVAMNFVFTTCTTVCPPMGATFGKLERLLEQTDSDARLISVSIDPAVDTPARLKAWSQSFAAGDRWTLVTGTPQEVNKLLKALGVFSSEKGDHSPVALIGNAETGEWLRTSGFTAPIKLADELARLAAAPRQQPATAADAVEVGQ